MILDVDEFRKKIKFLSITEDVLLSPKFRDDRLLHNSNIIIVLHDIGNNNTTYEVITPDIAARDYRINVDYSGQNSAIVIWDDISIKSLNISLGEFGFVYFGKAFKARRSMHVNLSNRNGTLCFGDNCNVGNVSVYAGDEQDLEVIVGDQFISALNLQLRPSDGHTIYSLDNPNVAINKPSFGIHIAHHVWVGINVFLGKDVIIPSDCIIGAGSLVTKRRFKSNSCIAGIPAKVIRENVNWDERTVTQFEKVKKEGI